MLSTNLYLIIPEILHPPPFLGSPRSLSKSSLLKSRKHSFHVYFNCPSDLSNTHFTVLHLKDKYLSRITLHHLKIPSETHVILQPPSSNFYISKRCSWVKILRIHEHLAFLPKAPVAYLEEFSSECYYINAVSLTFRTGSDQAVGTTSGLWI